MKKEHSEIVEAINNRISNSDSFNKNRYMMLCNIVTDSEHKFFSEVDMDVAITILRDIGYDDKNALDKYKKLILEDMEDEYVIIDDKALK